ncbi:WD repeat domain-containing protein [Xylariaceae sp. FL0016]|nr:WD repeat domain-containing protein [Xylariaceae sp. FL0016]
MAQYANSKLDRPEPGLIKWSPNPAYDSFLHVNLQHRVVQLYKPTGVAQPGRFDYEKVAKFDEIPPLSTYDWSPAHTGFVAIGTASGTVNLLNLHGDSKHYLEHRLKVTRFVQAVAFSTGSLLAVGLERVRNDQCLQIWDVAQLTKTDPNVSSSSLDSSFLGEPLHRFEPSTSVSSIKFFEDHASTLVVGIKNQGLRIYDLRDPNEAVINFQTKCNNNIAIDYADTNYFASSSLDRPGVAIWDRRATSRPSSSTFYLDAVDNDNLPWGSALNLDKAIDINPGNIPERGSLVRSLRYCRDHRGLLGVLSRTGQLRVFDTHKEHVPSEKQYEDSPELLEARRSHELDMGYVKEDRKHDQIVSFDWMTLGSPAPTPRTIVLRASGAYDILEKPSFTSEHLFKMTPWQAPYRFLEGTSYHGLMQFEASQYSEMLGALLLDKALNDAPVFGNERRSVNTFAHKIAQSPSQDDNTVIDFEANDNRLPDTYTKASTVADKLRDLRKYSKEILYEQNLVKGHKRLVSKNEKTNATKDGPPSARLLHESLLTATLDTQGFPKPAHLVLDHVMLLRSKEKYLFDYSANRDIVSDDPWLRDMWDWVAGATEASAEEGMAAQGIDFSYLGVLTMWANDLGRKAPSRHPDTVSPDAETWERCFHEINIKSGQPKYNGVETKKPSLRQAAMRVCRWGRSFTTDMSDYAKASPSERNSSWYTMATARALFEGNSKEAVQILKKASKEYPELLFVSLALQLVGRGDVHLAKEQLDFDDTVASKTDPYLRAISSLIATNDWETIANQESLPLRERTFVALRYFDDEALTLWLSKELEKAIKTGDIEGLVLTGITDNLVDIFAKYIEKFNDVQTATLVLSICSPRYIDDYRCQVWRNAYRAYLQRHKAFIQRTKFEVESTKKSRLGEDLTIKPRARQIALRCVYCDAEQELRKTSSGPPSTQGQANPLMASNIHAGISCPVCGRHLPRCVVCLEVVGIPRSDKPEGSPDPQVRVAARFPTFCLRCDHVLHLDHARQWFARHVECPVPECRCRCNFRVSSELNHY